jgi:uncharacterized repeat protein (TIGR01451 family)
VAAVVALLAAGLVVLAGPASGGAAAPQADLSVAATDSADPVFTHAAFAYTVDVANAGPDVAKRVTLRDRLPSGLDFHGASESQGRCRHLRHEHTVLCRLRNLASGGAAQVVIHVSAGDKARTISTRSVVTSHTHDPNRLNNSHTETTSVIARPPAATCQGERAGIHGGDGDDTLTGGEGDNVVAGFAGNDQIFPDGGADLVCAGGGDDLVAAGAGADRIYGGDEIDKLQGEGGDDNMRGGDGPDVMLGGDDADVMRGQRGTDVLKGKDGGDVLRGGPKVDVLRGGKGNDVLIGGAGNDKCFGGAGHDNFIDC